MDKIQHPQAEEPWVTLRNTLIEMCLRKSAHSGELECSVCDMAFSRMFDFELHLIREHVGLARSPPF
uniref:C2H2-type domain-containing protein n=1 Tax=Steinernema glaseri TaxID=37863 RepID=A0A1I8APY0_9BILA